MQRGGFPVRTVVFGLFAIGTVYLLYLYNGTAGRLRDAEQTAERYRRGEETKVAELQVAHEQNTRLKEGKLECRKKLDEAIRSKDELQEKCENDKHEFTNRLNSLNQQHKMLKSQYDEHEVEQMRLEQEAKRVKEEFEQVEAQRSQEYQQLKAEKELEITRLKDQLADAQRQNARLQNEITNLQAQLQSGQQQLQHHQLVINKMNTQIQGLQQQLALANAQLVRSQKDSALNFQPQQQQHQQQQQQQQQQDLLQNQQEQHPHFQKKLESPGHEQVLPGQNQGMLAGGFAGVRNDVENMNMNAGNEQAWPQFNQKNQGQQDASDETLGQNLEDGNQVTNQSNSILMSRNDSISLDTGTASPFDAEQVSFSNIRGLNETDASDETLGQNLEDGNQVTNQSNSILMSRNDSISLDTGTASPFDAEQVSFSNIRGLNETGGVQLDVDNQHHQMAPPVHKDKEIEGPDAPVNSNVDGRNVHEIRNDEHQVAPPIFKINDKDKEADFIGLKDPKHQELQPLGLKPKVQRNSQEEEDLHRGAGLGRNEDDEADDAHNVLPQIPHVNPPRNFGQNPPVKRMEEEEDQYDKYEDDGQDDNNHNHMNGNIQINHPVDNAEDANYP